jgi:hypothetical protein
LKTAKVGRGYYSALLTSIILLAVKDSQRFGLLRQGFKTSSNAVQTDNKKGGNFREWRTRDFRVLFFQLLFLPLALLASLPLGWSSVARSELANRGHDAVRHWSGHAIFSERTYGTALQEKGRRWIWNVLHACKEAQG